MNRRTLLSASLFAFVAASGAPALAQEIRLKAMNSFPGGFPEDASFKGYLDKLKEGSKGRIQIEFVGGPEVTPRPQQGAALKNGIVDILFSAPSMAAGIFPESIALSGSSLSPPERRANGGHELLDRIHQKRMNAKYLVTPDAAIPLYIFLTKEPKRTPDGGIDFKGMKIRSSEQYIPFFRALGITPVVIGPNEIYTALERGTVDGIGWSATGVVEGGWTRFLKYWVEPPMYWTSTSVTMNLDKFNALPADLKTFIEETSLAYEKESYARSAKDVETAREAWRKAGMEPIVLTGAPAKAFVDLAFSSQWKANVENNPQLKDLDLAEVQKKIWGR
jgi:TRAP-type C4-dicarboxylate transport system substrate-binding protein